MYNFRWNRLLGHCSSWCSLTASFWGSPDACGNNEPSLKVKPKEHFSGTPSSWRLVAWTERSSKVATGHIRGVPQHDIYSSSSIFDLKLRWSELGIGVVAQDEDSLFFENQTSKLAVKIQHDSNNRLQNALNRCFSAKIQSHRFLKHDKMKLWISAVLCLKKLLCVWCSCFEFLATISAVDNFFAKFKDFGMRGQLHHQGLLRQKLKITSIMSTSFCSLMSIKMIIFCFIN